MLLIGQRGLANLVLDLPSIWRMVRGEESAALSALALRSRSLSSRQSHGLTSAGMAWLWSGSANRVTCFYCNSHLTLLPPASGTKGKHRQLDPHLKDAVAVGAHDDFWCSACGQITRKTQVRQPRLLPLVRGN